MHRRPEVARIRAVLSRSIHFRGLAGGDLDRLASMGRMRHLRNGELAGSAARSDQFWIVLSGSLRLSSVTPQGREFVYAMLGTGSFFGLGNVLRNVSSPIDAHASGATTLAVIDADRLLALLDERPHLWRHMVGLLHRRLTIAMTALRDQSVGPLPQRIARRLLGQAITCGNDLSGAATVELRITQGDLGRMLGTSRSRMNTAVKRLERDGLLEVGYGTVRLVDLPRLRQVAGPDVFAF